MRSACQLAALSLTFLLQVIPSYAATTTDPRTGLVIDEGWELVNAHCGACHSHALVTAQRGDAAFWTNTIRWMQRTQNLWQIPREQEAVLIDYLVRNYDETNWGRRPALPASLLPPAPDD